MSLSSALTVALSGLQAQSTAINTVASNISNASTPGYTEKSVNFSSISLGGDLGGVSISGYSRATNTALTASLNSSTSNASYLSTQYSLMQQVESILDSSSTDPALSSDIATFQSDWNALEASPESTIAQQTLIDDATTFANDIQTAASSVTALQKQVTSGISTNIGSLNSDLSNLQRVNTEIADANANNQPAVDFEDQQDTLINEISAITSVTVMTRSDGQVALYTPSGTTLLDGTAENFTYNGSTITNAQGQNVTSGFTGGSLQAQLNFVDTSASAAASTNPGVGVISKLNAQLSTLVGAFTSSSSSFQQAYSAAVTASTASGASQNGDTLASSFFTVSTTGGVPDPATFQVNASLLNSSADLPETGVTAIANSFAATSNYTASGLSAQGVTYSQLGAAILSTFQTATNSLQTASSDAATQQSYYSTTLANVTGVDTDTELVTLTSLQNAYAAATHIITTINDLFVDLEDITSST